MEEEDIEVEEVVEDIGEEDTSPIAVVWAEESIMTLIEETENTKNGMTVKAAEEETEITKVITQKNMKI